jgi:hypothetical protein
MNDIVWLLDTVDTGIAIAAFPRTLYQGSLEPGRHGLEQGITPGEARAQEEKDERLGDTAWDEPHVTEQNSERRGTDGEQRTQNVEIQRRRQFLEAPRAS